MNNITNEESKRNAIQLGVLCAIAYLAVYIARNVLGTVTPQMIAEGFNEAYIGKASSIYFIFYAVGQLINGVIGDKIKSKYMLSLGLLLAAISNISFMYFPQTNSIGAMYVYGLTGFFLSMIYAPMTKVIAENTTQEHAVRCSLGYTFSSLFGSPVAGVIAAVMVWQSVFYISSIALVVMAIACFVFFTVYEKKGIVKYNQFKIEKQKGGSIGVLLKRDIVRFAIVSIATGVIRTTVVFWMPTYISQYLGFTPSVSASIFTIATLVISISAFISVFIYEKLKSNMNLSLLVMFGAAAVSFGLLYFIKEPITNISLLILGILASNCASSMIWSVYCPSLRDTGMVSGATGFLDFASYMAASVASTIFATAVTDIGWGNLILVWCALMVVGIIVSIPFKKRK